MTRLIAGLVFAIGTSLPTQALAPFPSLFTYRYCNLRSSGVAHADALQTVLKEAKDSTKSWIWFGKTSDSSKPQVIETMTETIGLCHSFF